MKDERINFSVWVVTRACYIQTLVFFTKKIQKRLIYRIKNQSYAPATIIQQATCLANKIDVYQNTAANDFLFPENKVECATFSKIKLATGFFSCNEKIDWHMQLKDPEDQEALHRWNFFITELSTLKGERKPNDLFPWVESCINDWIDAFQDELKDPAQFASIPRWDSYTVGERISNAVIVYYYYKKKQNKKIQQALISMAVYLAGHLEYHPENFNHIINNSRALYLLGSYLQDDGFKKLATTILYNELPKLITGDGFLREGSSHYQLLFTRWLLEVSHFAKHNNDIYLRDFLSSYLIKLVDRCRFFLVSDDSNNLHMPLIGDISPDFPPSWIIDLPFSRLANEFVIDEKLLSDTSAKCSWNNLWEGSCERQDFSKRQKTEYFSESGWYKDVVGSHVMYYRLSDSPDCVPGHFHNDALHFCLFYKGTPILVDSGRKTYDQSDSWSLHGISAAAHNTVLIDGLSAIPERLSRYPRSYSHCQNTIKQKRSEDYTEVILSSNGFKRIAKSLNHRRLIHMESNQITITDSFEGKGVHHIKLFFHFDDCVRIEKENKERWNLEVGKSHGAFYIDDASLLSVEYYYGDAQHLGWRSREYGKVKEAPTIVITGVLKFPAVLKNTLIWDK